MFAVVLLIIALIFGAAFMMDRAARKRGSTPASGAEVGRRFRDAHRTARMRETFLGDVPGTDPDRHRPGQL